MIDDSAPKVRMPQSSKEALLIMMQNVDLLLPSYCDGLTNSARTIRAILTAVLPDLPGAAFGGGDATTAELGPGDAPHAAQIAM
jgi:hypothetical protein